VDLLKQADRKVKLAELEAKRAKRDADARATAADAAWRIKLKAESSKFEACVADQLRRERVFEDAIRRAGKSPPFWRSSLFVGALGAVVGGGICAGAVAAAR
jgi:hypothetical protein